jgi:cytoskeletal protein RodZ
METVGQFLRRHRDARQMSIEEIARSTRVPTASIERIEADRFDELPGEVFVRGFLAAYARAVEVSPDEALARYTASRRVAWVTPLPVASPTKARRNQYGVAIALVLLLILFTLALSIVLRPRGNDMPQELSQSSWRPCQNRS